MAAAVGLSACATTRPTTEPEHGYSQTSGSAPADTGSSSGVGTPAAGAQRGPASIDSGDGEATPPSNTQERVIPAVTRQVTRRVVRTPARSMERSIPAITRQLSRRDAVTGAVITETVVIREASTELVTIPATYETVTEAVTDQSGYTEYVVIPAGDGIGAWQTPTSTDNNSISYDSAGPYYSSGAAVAAISEPEPTYITGDGVVIPSDIFLGGIDEIEPAAGPEDNTETPTTGEVSPPPAPPPPPVTLEHPPLLIWDDLDDKDRLTEFPKKIFPDASLFLDNGLFGVSDTTPNEDLPSLFEVHAQLKDSLRIFNYESKTYEYDYGFVILVEPERIDKNAQIIKKVDGDRVGLKEFPVETWSNYVDLLFNKPQTRYRYIALVVTTIVNPGSRDNYQNTKEVLNEASKTGSNILPAVLKNYKYRRDHITHYYIFDFTTDKLKANKKYDFSELDESPSTIAVKIHTDASPILQTLISGN